jgi:pentatricopeptide repeat protein
VLTRVPGDLASIPSPASSTFTTIISGFCNPSSSDVAHNPPKPDITTALSWFDRLLQQPAASSHNDESAQNPSRPDQICWGIMLDALVEVSSEQSAYIADLNRLYDILVDCAPVDRLGVKVSDTLMVLESNLRVLDEFAKSRQSVATTSETEEARLSANFIARHLRRVADQLLSVRPSRNLAKYKATVTKILSGYLDTVAATSSTTPALKEMLPMIPLVAWLGSPSTPSIARPLVYAYISAPQKLASVSDLETIVLCALSLPVNPSNSDASDRAYTGLMPLLQAMSDVGVDFRLVSSKVQVALTEALYSNCGEREVSQFLNGLSWSFDRLRIPLAERTNEEGDVPRTPTPPLPSAEFHPPATPVIVDVELSRQMDQWFPSHPSVTVHDSYNTLQAAISGKSPRYPHPATLGRLINGLGRAGNITAAQSVYSIAQQVLFSPFVAQSPTWQSQAWFQIEDNMIIAYAHGGDMDAAFAHRSRITSAGGVPSPDAYGSLIECVKDTTDDTSNAMALFAECQMLGTKPNVYLYNTIISKLAKARKADFALELFQQMKANTSLRPSSITYGAVIAACARVGDAVAAEQLFTEMASQPNFRPRIPPYNTMMQLYTHTKPDRTKVLFYLNKMTEAKVQPSAHTYKVRCSYSFAFARSQTCCSSSLMHTEPLNPSMWLLWRRPLSVSSRTHTSVFKAPIGRHSSTRTAVS